MELAKVGVIEQTMREDRVNQVDNKATGTNLKMKIRITKDTIVITGKEWVIIADNTKAIKV